MVARFWTSGSRLAQSSSRQAGSSGHGQPRVGSGSVVMCSSSSRYRLPGNIRGERNTTGGALHPQRAPGGGDVDRQNRGELGWHGGVVLTCCHGGRSSETPGGERDRGVGVRVQRGDGDGRSPSGI